MNNKSAITKIKRWLKTEGNTGVKLAKMLKYKSSATISHWLNNGRVPKREVERVIKVLG